MSRYIPMAALFLVLSAASYKTYRKEFWYGILPGILTFPAVLVVSNMGVNIACSKLFFTVIPGVFVLSGITGLSAGETEEDVTEREKCLGVTGRIATELALGGFLLCFFVCRILLIRVTGCLPVTVKAPMAKVEYGPAKGVYVMEEPALYWNESYRQLSEMLSEDANVLYVGREQLFYACFHLKTATPSVQGTAVYNELYDIYYREFPDKRPQIVVFDNSLYTNPVYANYVGNEDIRGDYIREWIDQNDCVKETKEVGIYTVVTLSENR